MAWRNKRRKFPYPDEQREMLGSIFYILSGGATTLLLFTTWTLYLSRGMWSGGFFTVLLVALFSLYGIVLLVGGFVALNISARFVGALRRLEEMVTSMADGRPLSETPFRRDDPAVFHRLWRLLRRLGMK